MFKVTLATMPGSIDRVPVLRVESNDIVRIHPFKLLSHDDMIGLVRDAYRQGFEDGDAPLSEIPTDGIQPGSCWIEDDGQGPIACRWPSVDARGWDSSCSSDPTRAHDPSNFYTPAVQLLATGLTAAQCSWILSTTGELEFENSIRRARHLAAGGTVENYRGDLTEPQS